MLEATLGLTPLRPSPRWRSLCMPPRKVSMLKVAGAEVGDCVLPGGVTCVCACENARAYVCVAVCSCLREGYNCA